MLGTHILTHTFQRALFDRSKFIWDPPNLYGTHMIWWDTCVLTNQRECVEKFVIKRVLLTFLEEVDHDLMEISNK